MLATSERSEAEVLRVRELNPLPQGYGPRVQPLHFPALYSIVGATNMVKRKHVAILGFGREGHSLLRFLRKRGQTRTKTRTNAEITILDREADAKLRIDANDAKRVHWQLGKDYLRNLKKFNTIFRSPGVPYTLPQLYRARCEGVEVTSATKLFFELAAPYRKKLIGITGTKGKGTTASLLAHILKRAGKRVILAGNIGKPMLDVLPHIRKVDFVILELSSFQLQDLAASPHIAVVVDVFPDHQDEHQSLREYYDSKANIGRWQKRGDVIFYFADNPLSKSVAAKSAAKKMAVKPGGNPRWSAFSPRGSAIWKNYDMASAIAQFLGIHDKKIKRAIKNFNGLEHRLEFVRSIRIELRSPRKSASSPRVSAVISFVNDSAATNPVAAAAAVRSFETCDKQQETGGKNAKSMSPVSCPMSLLLLAGGRDKGLSYAPLAQAIRESENVKLVVLYGENRKKLEAALQGNKKYEVRIKKVNDLKSAVHLAYQSAKQLINSSTHQLITVLLSPASASFDQFKNYPDRGEQFKKMVRALKP